MLGRLLKKGEALQKRRSAIHFPEHVPHTLLSSDIVCESDVDTEDRT